MHRCAILHLEPRERLAFDLQLLADGGDGLRSVIEWFALAPRLDEETVLDAGEASMLGNLSPTRWQELGELARAHAPATLDTLLVKGLLVAEDSPSAERDQALRNTHWRSASAVMHYASRWHGVDTQLAEQQYNELNEGSLLDHLGAAPAPVRERCLGGQRHTLARPQQSSPLDALLARRVTCRNFDHSHSLTFDQFSTLLYRVFAARAVNDYAPGVQLLKKGVPSAGGLHAMESYLLV